MKELIAIQSELKAPKGQFNSFGKYKYRSAEDILEALKPILAKYECFVILSDQISLIGDRYYVIATATIWNKDGKSVSVTGIAREEDSKKGMDGSQITGTASSYARKYALNGLFAIDDTKDADTDEYAKKVQQAPQQPAKKQKGVFSLARLEADGKVDGLLQWLLDKEDTAVLEGKTWSLLRQLETLYIVDSHGDDFKKLVNLYELKKK